MIKFRLLKIGWKNLINHVPIILALLVSFGSVAQERKISGSVISATGETLPGVSVLVKGTSIGTTTDVNGNYAFSLPENGEVLIYSFIGMISTEVEIGGRSVVDVTMEFDVQALDEVVVVAYGTSSKKDLTGAVSVIGSEELNAFPATTVDEALQGKTAGVQITSNSGAPGASVSVNIRGVGTFGNTTPLYIVDGFPTQDISFINPTTIESLTVLKDASATALYGVRASNGVVIIQTKQGVKGKLEVELNSFIGFRSSPNEIDVLNASQFASFATELSTSEDNDVNGTADPYSGWDDPGSLRNINWQDQIFDQAIRRSTTLSIRGGSEKSKLAFTAGIYDEEGTLLGSEYQRYDLGLNTSFDIFDNLRVNANVKYIASKSFQPLGTGRDGLLNLYSTIPHLAPAGEENQNGGVNLTDVPLDGNGNFGAFPDVPGETFRDGRNWVARALENDQDNLSHTVLANADIEWDIIGGLSTQGKISARVDNGTGWFFQPEYYRSSGNIDVRPNAEFSNDHNTSNEWLAEYLLKYAETFGQHTVGVLGGTSAQRITFRSSGATGVGFLNNSVRSIAAADQFTRAEGAQGSRTLASMFARFNYSFESKYYVTATIRRDGVGDVFSPSNLYATFPSVAVGWNIDEESFMQDSFIDLLKLRGSWGETGNFQGIPSFGYTSFFGSDAGRNNTNYAFNGNTSTSLGLIPIALANPALQWETQVQSNIGFEGELLDNSVYFTFDYFNKKSEGLLFEATVPSQSGFTTQAQNGASVVNKGFELLVGFRKDVGDFSLDINGNITTIDNEVTAINSPSGIAVFSNEFLNSFNEDGFWYDITQTEVGGELGAFYGFEANGIFQNQAEIDALNEASPSGSYQSDNTSPGDRRFVDLNGDGQITGEDRTTIGSPIPDFYGSVNINVSYKGFDVGLNFYGTHGNEILNLVKRELESASGYGNSASYSNVSTEFFNNRWNGEGSTNEFSRALIDDNDIQNNRASSYFVEDGSYFRLRNLTLGYNLPTSLIGNIGLSSVRLYGSLQNLFTITNYSGSDPEIGQNSDINGNNNVTTRGIDAGAFPLSQSFTFGLNLKF